MQRPHGFQDFVGSNGFHSLLLIAAEAGCPVRIMSAVEPKARFNAFKRESGRPIALMRLWWLAGKPVARRVEDAFRAEFRSRELAAWFNVPVAQAASFVERTIRDMGTWGVDEGSMIARMDGEARRSGRLPDFAPSPLPGLRTPEFRATMRPITHPFAPI